MHEWIETRPPQNPRPIWAAPRGTAATPESGWGTIVADIEEEHHVDRQGRGNRVAGVRAVPSGDPHQRPKKLKRGAAPRFQAATKEA